MAKTDFPEVWEAFNANSIEKFKAAIEAITDQQKRSFIQNEIQCFVQRAFYARNLSLLNVLLDYVGTEDFHLTGISEYKLGLFLVESCRLCFDALAIRLLDFGANPNHLNRYSLPALYYTLDPKQFKPKTAHALLAKGADPFISVPSTQRRPKEPLICRLIVENNLSALSCILQVNRPDPFILIRYIFELYNNNIQPLIPQIHLLQTHYGHDFINLAPFEDGRTLLHKAVALKDLFSIPLLLDLHANPFLKDAKDKTSYSLSKAHRSVHQQIRYRAKRREAFYIPDARALRCVNAYPDALNIIPGMVFSKRPDTPTKQECSYLRYQTISNNAGYSNVPANGAPMTCLIDNRPEPIGYNCHIPMGLEKAQHVVFHVYGGGTQKEFNKNFIGPDAKNFDTQALLAKGCVVVELNLPDLLQNTFQMNMTQTLQNKILRCIHHFFRTFKHNPQCIHTSLLPLGLTQAKYFLYGCSFGGRTAVRHSQLFPNTFDGYISVNGNLSKVFSAPVFGDTSTHDNPDHLFPSNYTAQCYDPLFIVQNRDDNTVNLQAALDFYEQARNNNREHLVHLRIFDKGSMFFNKFYRKGHGLPSNQKLFFDSVFAFMQDGHQRRPIVDASATFFHYQTINRIDKPGSTPLDRAVSHAYASFHALPPAPRHLQPNWDQVRQAERSAEHAQKVYLLVAQMQRSASAYHLYMPPSTSITRTVARRTLLYHLQPFQEYYLGRFFIEGMSDEKILSNPFFLEHLQHKLSHIRFEKLNEPSQRWLLEQLFLGNPELMPSSFTPNHVDDGQGSAAKQLASTLAKAKALAKANFKAVVHKMIRTRSKVLETIRKPFGQQPLAFQPSLETMLALYHPIWMSKVILNKDVTLKTVTEEKQRAFIQRLSLNLKQHLKTYNESSHQSHAFIGLISPLDLEEHSSLKLNLDWLLQTLLFLNQTRSPWDISGGHLQAVALQKEILWKTVILAWLLDDWGDVLEDILMLLILRRFTVDSTLRLELDKRLFSFFENHYPNCTRQQYIRCISVLNRGTETKVEGFTPIQRAIVENNFPLVKMLLDFKAQIPPGPLPNGWLPDPYIMSNALPGLSSGLRSRIWIQCQQHRESVAPQPLVANAIVPYYARGATSLIVSELEQASRRMNVVIQLPPSPRLAGSQ